jgi:hypothetical protein
MTEFTTEPMTESLLIVDAHLDLALNNVRQLIDHTRPIQELRRLEQIRECCS